MQNLDNINVVHLLRLQYGTLLNLLMNVLVIFLFQC